MSKKKEHKIQLLGADKFILALEKHDRHKNSTGNTCQYILEVDHKFDLEAFIFAVESNEIVQWLNSFSLAKGIHNSIHWKVSNKHNQTLKVRTHKNLFNKNLNRIKLDEKSNSLLSFEVFNIDGNSRTIVLTWHHLLMDGYGAGLLIQNLISPFTIQPQTREKSKIDWDTFKQAVKAKKFVSSTSKGKIAVLPTQNSSEIKQVVKTIEFDQEETQNIEAKAKANGAIFGPSSFFLAATSLTVQKLRIAKGLENEDFWIPVPQNNRKKGEKWPITGNHLSFLFYRLKTELFNDLTILTKDINKQMLEQVKNKNGIHYNHLMNYLRPVPSSLYSRLIKGPNGNSLSSFLFTVASDNNASMETFFGGKITNQLSIPPNTFPPGLTFAYNYFDGRLTVIIQSYEHLLNEQEYAQMEKDLKRLLN